VWPGVTEFELKFEVPAVQRASLEAAVRHGAVMRTRLQARYFDTADGRLQAQALVLRLRKEGRDWVQTAKAAGDGPLQRLEHNAAVPGASAMPVPDTGRHAGTPVGELLAQALASDAGVPAAPLVEQYRVDVWRLTRQLRAPGGAAELALDQGAILAGERTVPVCELEIELKSGEPAVVVTLARRWALRYGLWLSTVSKSARGQRLLHGAASGPPVPAQAPQFGRRPAGPQVVQAVVAACLAQLLPNASEIAGGRFEAEHVHQLRVAIRRLRTALRALVGLSDAIDPGWEAPLAAAFRALGAYRDRENLVDLIQPQLVAAGGPPVEWPASDPSLPAPPETVRSAAFQVVLLDLIALTLAPALTAAAPDHAATLKRLRSRLDQLQRQVGRGARRFDALSQAQRHQVRRRLKRLRYLGELTAPLFDKRAAKGFLSQLKPAQEALGRYVDEAMALKQYRAATVRDPRAWFGVGWLSARAAVNARACRQALKKAAAAPAFWTKGKA
jgi:triphosphatase